MIAVTGAGGFVGRGLCAALEAMGLRVRPVTHADAEITDRAALAGLFAGAEAVVHLAGRAHRMRDSAADPMAEFRRVNVEGTVATIEAAADAGARRVLIASSVKAVGERNDAPWTETTVPAPADPYGVSKLEAEAAAVRVGAARGVEAVVMRFPLVYGPGAPANVLRLLQLVNKGLPLPFGAIRNRRSMLSTGNLCAAVAGLLRAPGIGGERFFLSDGVDLSTPELIRTIAAALGKPARLLPVPVPVLRAMGVTGDLVNKLVHVPVTSAEIHRLTDSLTVSTEYLTRRTGYRPALTPAEGWQETVAWYRGAR